MKTMISTRPLIPVAALALLLAACGRPGPEPGATTSRTTDTTVATAGKVADPAITASVKSALAADTSLSALKIDVDTKDGVVTLKGPAPNEAARTRATEIATGAKGVSRVDNQLAVQNKS